MRIRLRHDVTQFGLFLAALAILMQTAAVAAALWMTSQGGFSLEICTAWGTRTITLDENGAPTDAPAPDTQKHDCPLCLNLAQNHLSPPAQVLIPSPLLNFVKSYKGWRDADYKSKTKIASYHSRAPPVLS